MGIMLCDQENELFSARQIDEVTVLHLKGNLLRHFSDLHLKETLFDCLHKISAMEDAKVVLLFGSTEKFNRIEAIDFFKELSQPGVDVNRISRIYYAVNQLILMIRQIPKLVVHADAGEVIAPFMNVGLACDYRIVEEDTVFQYPTLELGLVPKGGGIFFLSKIIGVSKTLDLLLSGEDINAEQALGLGLVNKVVPAASLETDALETARKFARRPLKLISGTKKLLNFLSNDLPVFLELENQVLLDAIGSERFRRRLNQQL